MPDHDKAIFLTGPGPQGSGELDNGRGSGGSLAMYRYRRAGYGYRRAGYRRTRRYGFRPGFGDAGFHDGGGQGFGDSGGGGLMGGRGIGRGRLEGQSNNLPLIFANPETQ